MRKDLRDIAIKSAASRYGSEHYRALLFAHSLRYLWPVLGGAMVVAGVGWLCWPVVSKAEEDPNLAGVVIVGGLVVIALVAALVRHIRSPYRRRRYR